MALHPSVAPLRCADNCYECSCNDRPGDPFLMRAASPLGTQCRFGSFKLLLSDNTSVPDASQSLASGDAVIALARLAQLAARRFNVSGANHGWWSEFVCTHNASSAGE